MESVAEHERPSGTLENVQLIGTNQQEGYIETFHGELSVVRKNNKRKEFITTSVLHQTTL